MSGLLNELVEIVGAEVGHADRPNTTLGKKLHRSPVGIDRCLESGRDWPMKQKQVKDVEPQLLKASIEGVEGLVVAIVADPELGRYEICSREMPEERTPSPTCRSFM